MVYDQKKYDTIKSAYDQMDSQQRQKAVDQYKDNADFQSFAKDYAMGGYGKSGASTPTQEPSNPQPVENNTQNQTSPNGQNWGNGSGNQQTSPQPQPAQTQTQQQTQPQGYQFGYQTDETYRKQRDSQYAEQLFMSNPNAFDYNSVYNYIHQQAPDVSPGEVRNTVENIQRQYHQLSRVSAMNGLSAEKIREGLLNGTYSQNDLEQLRQKNPEKYNEYLTYHNKRNTVEDAAHNAKVLYKLGTGSSVKEERTPEEILLKMVEQFFGKINYDESIVNRYKEALNSPGIQKQKDKMLDAQREMDDIDDELDSLRDDIKGQYPGIPKSQLNAIVQDRSVKLLKRKNELHKDYQRAKGDVQFEMNLAGMKFEADLKGIQIEREEFSDKMTALGFAKGIFGFETPQQQRDAELEQIKKKSELEAELSDINSKDPKIQFNAVMKALDQYYKDFGSIILRPQAQAAQDIINLAKREKISVGEAMRKNFTEELFKKPEYKAMVNKQIGYDPNQNITKIGDKSYITSYNPDGTINIQPFYDNQTTQSFVGSGMKGAGLRNNNPGNIKDTNFGNVIGKDHRGFAQFATPEDGFDALVEKIKFNQNSPKSRYYGKTIAEYFKLYAPSSDGNNPINYANSVAKQLGVSVNTKISQLNPVQFARHIAKHDSGYDYSTYGKFRGHGGNLTPEKRAVVQDIYSSLMRIFPTKADGSYIPGFEGAVGTSWQKLLGGKDGIISGTDAASYKTNFDNFINLQVLPNLSLLKGAMSDKDIEFIKLSASALSLDMSEQAFIENITEIRQKLEEQLGIVSHFNNQQVQVEDWYGSGSIMENTDLSDFPQ